MSSLLRILILIAPLDAIYGCGQQPKTYATPGTLYVQFDDLKITEIRSGKVVGARPLSFIVPREKPDRSILATDLNVCRSGNDPGVYALSPNGTWAICSSTNDESLRIFETSHPRSRRLLSEKFSTADSRNFAWVDANRFVAMVLDKACPETHLYDFFRARAVTFDRNGDRLANGPCALGVVAGNHRIALLGEAENGPLWNVRNFFAGEPYDSDGYDRFHLTWSLDEGQTWHDGRPLAFDGNDVLLYREPFTNVVRTEGGQVAFKDALGIQWSR